MPGHEIAGEVLGVGLAVTKFKVGDRVGVGCMVDSCRQCASCRGGEENYCSQFMVLTYGARYRFPHCAEYTAEGGNVTYGGYSQHIVVDENFVVRVPLSLDFSKVAPLLCAGITTYSPIAHFGLSAKHRFAVAGLGGLGHMAVKFGVALGAHVTVLSRGAAKRESALDDLKAHAYVDVTSEEELRGATGSFDFILDTIAAQHDLGLYVSLLARDGKLVMVGAPPDALALHAFPLILGRKSVGGSSIGSVQETQDMLDFCGEHGMTCDVELVTAAQINEAYERTLKSDVKYRFVIDVESM